MGSLPSPQAWLQGNFLLELRRLGQTLPGASSQGLAKSLAQPMAAARGQIRGSAQPMAAAAGWRRVERLVQPLAACRQPQASPATASTAQSALWAAVVIRCHRRQRCPRCSSRPPWPWGRQQQACLQAPQVRLLYYRAWCTFPLQGPCINAVCMLQGGGWNCREAGKAPQQTVTGCQVTLLGSGCLPPVVAQQQSM